MINLLSAPIVIKMNPIYQFYRLYIPKIKPNLIYL